MAEASEIIQHLNNFWLGYRYTVISMPAGITNASSVINAIGLATLGISEVVFPTQKVDMFKIPSLSTVERHIPKGMNCSELILKAPTFRNTAFWDRVENQKKSLSDPTEYSSVTETIMIVEFETRPGPSNVAFELLGGFLPLCVWICNGCQAKSITPAPANTQGSGRSVPLEQLALQVDSIERL